MFEIDNVKNMRWFDFLPSQTKEPSLNKSHDPHSLDYSFNRENWPQIYSWPLICEIIFKLCAYIYLIDLKKTLMISNILKYRAIFRLQANVFFFTTSIRKKNQLSWNYNGSTWWMIMMGHYIRFANINICLQFDNFSIRDLYF